MRRAKGDRDHAEQLLEDCEVAHEDLMVSLERLTEFLQPYLERLGDKRLHQHGENFIRGLLSDLDRKSVEPIAERTGYKDRLPLQYFVGQSQWKHGPLLDELCRQTSEALGDPNGILVIDPSAFPKKGKHSVGVARQWCGRLGKQDNCQVGVFLGYVSNRGHTLINERLYLPRAWAKDKARRLECAVPRGVRFRTSPQLAIEMLLERRQQFPHAWVVADDEFGRPAWFRRKLCELGERYVLDIPSNTLVRDLQTPAPPRKTQRGRAPKVPFIRAATWKDGVAPEQWERVEIRDATKGPLVVWATRTRVETRRKRKKSEKPQWLIATKTEGATPEYRYQLSNGEEDVPLRELVHVGSARFWVEDCLERAKGEVGLDHYEVRGWMGWHHHMTSCLLALFFLVLEQKRLSERTPAITVQQSAEAIGEILRDPQVDLRWLAQKLTGRLQRTEQSRIDHWKKFRRLPPSWNAVRLGHVPSVLQ